MSSPVSITIPVDWEPRDYQRPAWEALESGVKRLDLVWHRRAGKDLFTMNWTATQAFQRRGDGLCLGASRLGFGKQVAGIEMKPAAPEALGRIKREVGVAEKNGQQPDRQPDHEHSAKNGAQSGSSLHEVS